MPISPEATRSSHSSRPADNARSLADQGNVPQAGLEFNAQRRAVLDNHVAQTLDLAEDAAAALAVLLVAPQAGERVLDLCAAPGGKTMQLAAAGWQVTAVEREERRLARLSENLERTHLSADLVTADVLKWEPKSPVDAVLLDAPCSATGIFARHPDVLHRIRPRDIAQLAEVQARMVARVADWLKPGMHLSCMQRDEPMDACFEKADLCVFHTRMKEHEYVSTDFAEMEARHNFTMRDHPPGTIDWNDFPDLGELVSGRTKARTRDDEITFFLNSTGVGAQFTAVAHLIYERARAAG